MSQRKKNLPNKPESPVSSDNTVTSISLPCDVLDRLNKVAASEARSRSFVVVRAIKRDLGLLPEAQAA